MTAPVIFSYLQAMAKQSASDLYITYGFPAAIRADNKLIQISDEKLDGDKITEIVDSLLTTRQKRDFEIHREMNTSLDMGRHGRYRINVMQQRQYPALVIRRIISQIPSFEELNLPPLLGKLAMEKRGLILLTGMTGSGKSTSIASMIDFRNSREEGHIITIEDPIEYFHEHKRSLITQREVGIDTDSYAIAMKNALRQRPDVILVGEIRDREVMEQALTISETGHLCLSTIHTNNSYQALERIVNLFPEDQHGQIRMNLALNLRAIISQRLIPSVKGDLTCVLEIMLNQGLVKELIMKGDVGKIPEIMAQNQPAGMCTFDQSLFKLYANGVITAETALAQADQASDLKIKIQQFQLGGKDSGGFDAMDTSVLSISD